MDLKLDRIRNPGTWSSNANPHYPPAVEETFPKLQRQAEISRQRMEQSLSAYKAYQQNIASSAQLQTEIRRGIKEGEPIYRLFLKATEAISCMTADRDFYDQIKADMAAIYGRGLLEEEPARADIAATEHRLSRLRTALGAESTADGRERLQKAIKAHEAKIKAMENALFTSENKNAPANKRFTGA